MQAYSPEDLDDYDKGSKDNDDHTSFIKLYSVVLHHSVTSMNCCSSNEAFLTGSDSHLFISNLKNQMLIRMIM
jgi:hypothetical protein